MGGIRGDMDRDALQEALENVELTSYQSTAYLTLIDNGRLSAVDVAKKSSIPVSQIYKTLRALEDRGFVETIEQDKLHAEPREPIDILSHLRKRGELLNDAANELEDLWERPPASEHRVSVVKHEETVIERVRNRLPDTAVSAEIALTMDQIESLAPDLIAAAERGVGVHASIYWELDIEERCQEIDLLDSSVEIRVASIPGPFLSILDRRSTYFSPNDQADEMYGILIEDEILSFINHWYFRTCLWSVYPALDDENGLPTTYLSLEEFIRDIALLYHNGATITVTIEGQEIDTDRPITVQGTVSGLFYPGILEDIVSPSIEQLSGFSSVFLDAGETVYSIGSWGSVFEDIEALKLTIDDIEFPTRTTLTKVAEMFDSKNVNTATTNPDKNSKADSNTRTSTETDSDAVIDN
jgi:sugar-specific transcriptional regulator TrmB